ncbi:MAG: hypothetical protein HOV81_01940, partial [Kofleriaceae bacterium]|nr:hypothetical protein [Kofleriaceae bacterium]
MVDRDGGAGPRTELDLEAQAKAAVEAARTDKPTELDLNAAAAAAVEAAREQLAQGTPVDQHETLIGRPAETGTPPPKKARVSVFAPTAAASDESHVESVAPQAGPEGTGQI